jgi:hypothetical protein
MFIPEIHYGRPAVCRVPKTHGKGLFAHGKRQTGVGKEILCRVPFIGHTANSLPSAKKHSAKKFS